jgi:hypothetical protein
MGWVTNRENASARVGIVRRLMRRENRAAYEIFGDLGIDVSSFYRDRRNGRVSDRNFERIVEAYAAPSEVIYFREMYSLNSDAANPSIVSLLARRTNDVKYWEYQCRKIRISYGYCGEHPTDTDLLNLNTRAVINPRVSGDYVAAMRNGLILLHWWLGVSDANARDMLVGGTFLYNLYLCASRVGHSSLHRRTVKIGHELMKRNPSDLLVRRIAQSAEGQLWYNENEADKVVLRRALDVHAAELETAETIISTLRPQSSPPNSVFTLASAYYDRLNIKVKLGIRRETFQDEYKRMEDRCHYLISCDASSELEEAASKMKKEIPFALRLLHIRQSMSEKSRLKAVDEAERLIEELEAIHDSFRM